MRLKFLSALGALDFPRCSKHFAGEGLARKVAGNGGPQRIQDAAVAIPTNTL